MNDKANTDLARERKKPTLVTIDGKDVIDSHRWNNEIMARYLMDHGRDKWLLTGELARVAFGQNKPSSKTAVRRNLHRLFRELLSNGELLVVEYSGPNNCATAAKIFDPDAPLDCANLHAKLDRMLKRRELTAEQHQHAVDLMLAKERRAVGRKDGDQQSA